MNYATILLGLVLLCQGTDAQAQQGSGRHLGRPSAKQKGPLKPSKYTAAQFEGRWQETGRANSKTNAAIAIVDTTYLRFYDGTKADTKQGASLVITGAFDVLKDDYITTSAEDYKVTSLTDNEMVLDDEDGYIHTFNKKDQFAYELVIAPPVAVVDTSAAVVDLTPGSLIKNWFSYRRKADPGLITNQTAIIRDIKIKAATDNSTYKGEIEFSQSGKAITKPCTLTVSGNNMDIVTDSNTWNVTVLKCDGHEMILGKKDGIVYYFKNSN